MIYRSVFLFVSFFLLFMLIGCPREKTKNGTDDFNSALSEEESNKLYSINMDEMLYILVDREKNIRESYKTFNSKKQGYVHSNFFYSGEVKERHLLYLDGNQNTPLEMIGWSKNSLFAYRYIEYVENHYFEGGLGNFSPRYAFIIINTITNEIIEKDRIIIGADFVGLYGDYAVSNYYFDENGRFNTRGNITKWNTLKELTDEYKTKWNALLEKYHIDGEISNPFSLSFKNDFLEFPVNMYICWFDYIVEHNEGKDILDTKDIIKWKLLIGNDIVSKVVFETEEQRYFDYITGRKIIGYYKNPYENKIVIVVNYHNYTTHMLGGWLSGTLNLFGFNMASL